MFLTGTRKNKMKVHAKPRKREEIQDLLNRIVVRMQRSGIREFLLVDRGYMK
jgi:hypothetical protein